MIFRLLVEIAHSGLLCGLSAAKAHPRRKNLGSCAVVAVLVLVLTGLQAAFDGDHAALLEILTDELGSLPPRGDVDKIGLALFALPGKAAVNRDAEAAHVGAVLGGLELRVVDQTAHQCYEVKHETFLHLLSAVSLRILRRVYAHILPCFVLLPAQQSSFSRPWF